MLCQVHVAWWAEKHFLHSRKWSFLLQDFIPHLGNFNQSRQLLHISHENKINFKFLYVVAFCCCLCFCFLNKKLLISEPAMCTQVEDFLHILGRSRRFPIICICGCTAKVIPPRVISLHGRITTYPFLLLLCCAVRRKKYGTKISAKSSDEGRGDSFYSLKYALWAQKSIYNVVFVNTKMHPMKSSSLLCWLIRLLRHNTNWHIIMFSYCLKTEPN